MNDYKKEWEVYYQLMLANGFSSLYKSATQLQLLDYSLQEKFTAEEISKKLNYEILPLTRTLDIMVLVGILTKRENSYSLAIDMQHLKGNYQHLGDEYWNYLPELVKKGVPYKKSSDQVEMIKEYQAQVKSLCWMMDSSAKELVNILNVQTKTDLSVLDIGAGSGVWSYHFLNSHPQAQATLCDWPFLLEVAKENLKNYLHLQNQVQFNSGNVFEIPLVPENYNYVFMGNFTHLHSPEKNQLMLKKTYEALLPGGRLVIMDAFGTDPRGQVARALYQMGLTIKTLVGTVYSAEELSSWLVGVGFNKIEFHSFDVVPYTMGALIAKKPERK